MMISRSRVREETPQPTIRVTEGRYVLSMSYRNERKREKKKWV